MTFGAVLEGAGTIGQVNKNPSDDEPRSRFVTGAGPIDKSKNEAKNKTKSSSKVHKQVSPERKRLGLIACIFAACLLLFFGGRSALVETGHLPSTALRVTSRVESCKTSTGPCTVVYVHDGQAKLATLDKPSSGMRPGQSTEVLISKNPADKAFQIGSGSIIVSIVVAVGALIFLIWSCRSLFRHVKAHPGRTSKKDAQSTSSTESDR